MGEGPVLAPPLPLLVAPGPWQERLPGHSHPPSQVERGWTQMPSKCLSSLPPLLPAQWPGIRGSPEWTQPPPLICWKVQPGEVTGPPGPLYDSGLWAGRPPTCQPHLRTLPPVQPLTAPCPVLFFCIWKHVEENPEMDV